MASPGETPTSRNAAPGEPDVHRRVSSLPRLTSEEIRNRGFKRATRGVSEAEVRNFLHRIADELEASRAREEELERRVTALEDELRHPPPVTEEQLLDSLGEETARVLRAAQHAANEVRTKAETLASNVVEEAESTARQLREDADAFVVERRRDGEELAARLRDEAEARGRELRADAERLATEAREHAEEEASEILEQAREQGRTMVNQAKLVRERVLTDLARRRGSLRDQLQELRRGRDRLLEGYQVVRRTLSETTEALGGPASSPPDLDLEALATEAPEAADAEVDAVLAEAEEVSARAGSLDSAAPSTGETGEVPVTIDESPGSDEPPEEHVPDAEAIPPGRGLRSYVKGALGLGDAHGEPPSARDAGEEHEEGPTADELSDSSRERPDAGEVFAKLRAERVERVERESSTPEKPQVEAPSANGDGDASREPLDADAVLRAERDASLAPVEASVARAIKRTLQDEQNELLDSLRRAKRRKDVRVLVPEMDDVVERWSETIRTGVADAYGSEPAHALVIELATALVTPIHERVVAAVDEGGDAEELTQRVGARYREWRNQELTASVAQVVATAYSRAVFDATPDGTRLRWVPNRPGKCPDCDDNALEPTGRGKPFPTGQVHPPAHPGCRCLLIADS